MPHTTVRIAKRTHATLRRLADREGTSMQAVLDRALEAYRRQRFLEQVNEGYAALDAAGRDTLRLEQREWEDSLADGLAGMDRPARRAPVRKRARR